MGEIFPLLFKIETLFLLFLLSWIFHKCSSQVRLYFGSGNSTAYNRWTLLTLVTSRALNLPSLPLCSAVAKPAAASLSAAAACLRELSGFKLGDYRFGKFDLGKFLLPFLTVAPLGLWRTGDDRGITRREKSKLSNLQSTQNPHNNKAF